MIQKSQIDEIQSYLIDASNYKSNNCNSVYLPTNIEEISNLFNLLNSEGVPVTVSGAGTGLCGGRVPDEGVIVSTELLNKIIFINAENLSAELEAGVILNDFQNACNEKGIFYPPDPTETNCAIGGTIATNASGAKSFKYGQTRKWVKKLKVILPDGDILNLIRGENNAKNNQLILTTELNREYIIPLPEIKYPTVKNTAGYYLQSDMDAIDLFIGSEGTLGLISAAELSLVNNPDNILSFVIFFNSFPETIRFVNFLKKESAENLNNKTKKISPRLIEFFDNKALAFTKEDKAVSDYFGIWIEQEIFGEDEEFFIDEWMKIFNEFGIDTEKMWAAFDAKERQKLKDFRHSMPLKVNDYISQNNFRKVGTDIAVKSGSFDILYNYCTELCNKNLIDYVAYGHIGNDHLHLNMLPKNNKEYLLSKELYHSFCVKAVELGGTVSAEHGIGKLKKDYLRIMYPEETINAMRRIKNILDPKNILGRGNIF